MNKKDKPKISIILPIQNAAKTLSQCLNSILAQSCQSFEIIAIDDKSTDKSFSILKGYKKHNKHIRIFQNVKRYGLAITLNRALYKAKGQKIVFMDSKDTITKHKLEKQMHFLIDNPKVVAVGTQCIYRNDANKRIGKSHFPSLSSEISEKPVHGVSVLFEGLMIDKLRIPKDLLRFPTNKHAYLYSDMAVKLIQYGEIANIPEYLHFHKTSDYASVTEAVTHTLLLLRFWIVSKFYHNANISFKSFFTTVYKSFAS